MSGSNVTYNKQHNIFLSDGYTSAAGNTYFQGIRLNDRLLVKYDFGQGYAYLFLNGIRLYCHDGYGWKEFSSRSYYCCCWNETYARQECIGMLRDFLLSQSKMLGQPIDQNLAEDFATAMIRTVVDNKPPLLR